MKLHGLAAVVGSLCVLAYGHHHSYSTTETLVIAKSKDTGHEPKATTEPLEATTNAPLPPIKLTEMEVTSNISLRFAHTLVVAHVKNPAKRAQEAYIRVVLPDTAFISGFIMTLDGKSYKGFVKDKEEAKQIYKTAVSQGFGAAHVQAKARDSNQFVVSVNVEASSSAVFNLTYEELLIRRNGVYNHAINLHPGALVPKLSVTVHIKEAQKITDLRVPEIRTGNEIDATKDDAQNSKAVIERTLDNTEATIRFTPDLDEQKTLMEIYADKSKESANKSQGHNDNKALGVLGQFVVQYDVERPKDGEILVNDGYFVHFFAPSDLAPLPKFVVFVLDTSSSMAGTKITQLREAMQTILSGLNPDDYFNIVEFSTFVSVHDLEEANKEPLESQRFQHNNMRPPPSPATAENIAKAKVIVSRLVPTDNTNIAAALDVAIDIILTRTNGTQRPSANHTDVVTTSIMSTEISSSKLNTSAKASKDAFEIEKIQALEPMIILLTDGHPTVDVLDPTTIINQVTNNVKRTEEKITIFSLGFGTSADRLFLRKLSLRNNGFMRHIYEAADAALQLQDFYRRVSSPLLADVQFTYPNTQVQESSVTKNKFGYYFAGSELVVAGKVAEGASEVSAQINAFCKKISATGYYGRMRCLNTPIAPVPATKQKYLPLERLWSYLTIKQLLDNNDASDDNDDKEDSPKKKALTLALKYEFVTPLTSLVVVKPNASVAVNAESVEITPTTFKFRSRSRTRTKSMSGSSSSTSWNPASDLDGHAPAPTPAVQARLFHLQEYSWTEPMIDTAAEALVLALGNNTHYYKLTKDTKAPIVPEGSVEAPCAGAVGGGAGRCVYLTRCEAAKHITEPEYYNLHCSYHGFAGVCCSEKDIINAPATAQ